MSADPRTVVIIARATCSLLIVASIGLLLTGCGSGDAPEPPPGVRVGAPGRTSSWNRQPPAPARGRLGQTVHGKEFAYTVREKKCGLETLNTPWGAPRDHGGDRPAVMT
ncbi:hypothetical protein LUW74_43725 [Actinomadura madurae]|uniref:hypothetical protein n=1 Tax=Actinomadura madurae TaxID=1993 RepID=UPI002026033D|nr:hypothetical protein [Actinomadura madurae]URN09585.1 hypothetical protein LUW74_43725 [Actinomadura madurae]